MCNKRYGHTDLWMIVPSCLFENWFACYDECLLDIVCTADQENLSCKQTAMFG
jgi:hypothetical protein